MHIVLIKNYESEIYVFEQPHCFKNKKHSNEKIKQVHIKQAQCFILLNNNIFSNNFVYILEFLAKIKLVLLSCGTET